VGESLSRIGSILATIIIDDAAFHLVERHWDRALAEEIGKTRPALALVALKQSQKNIKVKNSCCCDPLMLNGSSASTPESAPSVMV
jgi:hypothetical protein